MLLLTLALAGSLTAAARGGVTEPVVDCAAFVVTGNPQAPQGAAWTYDSTDDGVRYVLKGVLFTPPTAGKLPAVLLSHGKGGTPQNYSANVARTMVTWGLVAIATMYTHAPDAQDAGNEPQGPDGASEANVLRAHKARDLLSCLGTVDLTRVAAHGHSMGAFVTGQVLGTYPGDFLVATHTAGGVGTGPNATQPAVAANIVTPYSLHHSNTDTVVPLAMDRALAVILEENQTPHRLVTAPYAGLTHAQIAAHPLVLERIQKWYRLNGLFLH